MLFGDSSRTGIWFRGSLFVSALLQAPDSTPCPSMPVPHSQPPHDRRLSIDVFAAAAALLSTSCQPKKREKETETA